MSNWKEVSEDKVRIVFEKDCDCPGQGIGVQFTSPSGLAYSGVPICPTCGEDYDFVQVKVFEAN